MTSDESDNQIPHTSWERISADRWDHNPKSQTVYYECECGCGCGRWVKEQFQGVLTDYE